MKKYLFPLIAMVVVIFMSGGCTPKEDAPIGMAVEFTDHAACAYISQDKGWYEKEGLNVTAYESYVTGMALSSALTRGDIQVAYICLIPAINVYANAKVPIKIVAGTHKHGYGLVVDPKKVKNVQDLEQTGVRIGCVQEGGAVDVLLYKTIDTFHLNENKVLNNVQRMNPAKIVLSIKMGQLDAAFLPEQWATMAEELDFKMLMMSQDIWPDMQGSVLVVKEELINNHPDTVEKLVKISQEAMDWANQNPDDAAGIIARQLSAADDNVFPAEAAHVVTELKITPEVVLKSMERLDYTANIEPEEIQETIDYIAGLGYIKNSFNAEDILDLRFIKK